MMGLAAAGVAVVCGLGGSPRPPGEPLMAGDIQGVSLGDIACTASVLGAVGVRPIEFVVVVRDVKGSACCGNMFGATILLPGSRSHGETGAASLMGLRYSG